MGRKGKGCKRRRPRNPDFQNRRKKNEWQEITRKNDLFEKFYKAQNIIPESEWEEFMETFKKELSSTFRITGSRSQAQKLCFCLKAFYLRDLENVHVNGKNVDPPTPLPWYPNELAWQVNLPKMFIRKVPSMEKFHNFLVHETESGNISRQEAVSMIPPLLLDVKPGHKVLDTCAAPGSKTSQIIEMLHNEDSSEFPDGLVIANDVQNKRCYMLVHQSKRLHSPCVMITNHDATLYPTIYSRNEDGSKVAIKFDRILCDVPCSGDGTMRKNPLIWNKWTPRLGLSLHRVQLRILARAVEMLAVGGKIVYSTCTLNPIEDEAVVGTLLQKAEGAMELVDVTSQLPQLIRSPGLRTWKVMGKDGEEFDNCEPGSPAYSNGFKQSMFALPEETAEALQLDRCMRVYPHQQDTGGFFIAVLQKKCEAPWENEKRYNKLPRLLPWETEEMTKEGKRILKVIKHRTEMEREKGEGNNATSSVEKSDTSTNPGDSDNLPREGEGQVEFEVDNQEITGEEQDSSSDTKLQDKEDEDEDLEQSVEQLEEEEIKKEITSDKPEDETEELLSSDVSDTEKQKRTRDSSENTEKELLPNESDGQPPEKKIKLHNLYRQGFKEDPFVFLEKDDEHWPQIQSFYGFKDNFPFSQLMTRSSGGKKRHIYLVSKAVKGILEASAEGDELKVVNSGLKTISRSEADDVECDFRLIQEGIDMIAPFITKRLIQVTQRDVILLLLHDKPFMRKFSETTRDQLQAVGGMGCVVFIYDPDGKYSKPDDRIKCHLCFNGWKAKTSTRVLMSKNDRMHYLTLCGIPPGDKVKEAIRRLREDDDDDEIEEEIICWAASTDSLTVQPPEGVADIGYV